MKKLFTLLTMLVACSAISMAETYLVVGQSAIANGKSWNNDANANVMTTADEGATYTLTISDLALNSGSYEYKIVEKGSWTEYYPNNGYNASFTISEGGVYDIKYIFTVSTSSCEVQTTKKSSVIPNAEITSVQICGATDNAWNNKINVNLELQDDKYVGTLTMADATLDYQFKLVVNNDEWIGYNSFTLNDAGSLITAQSNNGSNLILHNSTSDYKTYTFTATWVESTNAATGWTVTLVGDEKRELNYNVVGTEPLTGFAWDYSETSNTMTEKDGIYTWNRNDIYLDGSNQEFRIAKYYRASTQYPSGDANWVINNTTDEYTNGAGYYDVTITFEPANENLISVSVKKHNTTYAVTFVNKQSWEKVYAWAWNSDNSGFNGMTWPGVELEKTGTDGGYDVYTYSFSNHNAAMPVGILFNGGGEAQTSDFTFENGAKYEPVTSIEVSMTKDFETFSSKYALDFTSTAISAYRATISDGKVVLTKVGKVPANTGVLLQKNGAKKENVPTTYGTESFGENLFVATDGTTDITASAEGSYNYVLQTNDGVQGFYNVTSTITAPAAGKAYLHATTALANEAKAREAWIFAGGETTGINTVRETVNDNRYYNLAGQRVSQPGRGLYIVNGKKVVIK